ncbi:MAG: Sir2 family NAD-dependent protein deacetylase [Bacteroidota bacterium]
MKELQIAIDEVLAKKRRNKFTFLTGAGISADSGIPTYRGSDGIWVKGTQYHKPEEFGTYNYFMKNQEEVWQYTLFRKKMIENAQPNESHRILAKLEKILGERFHLITQNIDNLHRRAGNKNIYEIHGNYREVKSAMDCKEIYPIPDNLSGKDIGEELRKDELDALKCPVCGDWFRPNILWFDEFYDEKTHKRFSSLKIAKNSGILFIVGTSGATNLPLEIARTTLRYGGYVVDMNIEDNHFTDLLKGKKRAITLRGRSSEILPLIKNQIQQYLK